jgi:hypothetical protein
MPLLSCDEALRLSQSSNCFEFWLNRYQTLVGVLAALAAAVVAWLVGFRQLERLDVGLAISQRQSAAASLDTIVNRRILTIRAVRAVTRARSRIKKCDLDTIEKVLKDCNASRWWFVFWKNEQISGKLFSPISQADVDSSDQKVREFTTIENESLSTSK